MKTTNDAPPVDPILPALERLWLEALGAAGMGRDQVELVLFDGDPTARAAQWGMHLARTDTTHDLEHCFTQVQLDAVDNLNLYKHRVAIWIGEPRLEAKIIQALMRHELRHAEQVEAGNWIYRIGIMCGAVLGDVYGGKNGASALTRLLPHEADADAASTQLVSPADDVADVRDGNFRSLVTKTGPLRPLSSLGPRTLAFAALYPNEFVTRARALVSTERLVLEELDPDGPDLFAELVEDVEMKRLRAEAAAAIPTTRAIDAAGARSGDAWHRCRDVLARALARAEDLIEETRATRSDSR